MNLTNLLDIKTISNIELIKCYKLTFSIEGITKNYGYIIIIFFIVSYLVLIVVYLCHQKPSISKILKRVIKMNNYSNPPRKSAKNFSLYLSRKSPNIENNPEINKHSHFNLISGNKKKIKRKNKNNLSFKLKSYQNINLIKKANIYLKDNQQIFPRRGKTRKQTTLRSINKLPSKNIILNEKIKSVNKNSYENIDLDLNYNYCEEELNDLEYNVAVIIDKRTFSQYYYGLLRRKHILLSIFISKDDFNLIYIKIGLFIFGFCMYFTMNALFFTDKTMHKIYEDKGLFQIFGQLPHIIYSTFISAVINMIIKKFALSEKDVLELKKEKKKNVALEKVTLLYKNLIVRFNLYFAITLLLLILFWYYISTFCAVYKNIKILLIENTLLCLSLTLVYPFCFDLIPGIFRIPALRASNKDKECFYKLGKVVSLII